MTQLDRAVLDPERVKRFWEKVDRRGPDDCWMWLASRSGTGYGQISIGDRQITRAHRFSYVLHHGALAPGFVVRHHCDVPLCVNPRHLAAGTQADNVADAVSRGRASGGRTQRFGTSNPNAKLTSDFVSQIRNRRSAGESITSIAAAFGISKAQASRIATGKRWPEGALV